MVRHHPNSSHPAVETLEATPLTRAKPVALCDVHRETDHVRTTVVIIRDFAAPRAANETMASALAAGWHLCFDVADAVLAGKPKPPMRGPGAMKHGWAGLNRRYARALGVAPTKLATAPVRTA